MNRNNDISELRPRGSTHEPSSGFLGEMFTHVRVSIIATIVLAVIVSGIYPAIVWGLAQALFRHQANGSLLKKDGTPTDKDEEAVGSALLGQSFSDAGYLHPRPSAAGGGYDPTASGGTNLGPLSAKLLLGKVKPTTMPATQPPGQPLPGPDAVDFDGISDRIVHYCVDNGIPFESSQPLDRFKDKDGNLDDVKLIKAFNDDKDPLRIMPRRPIPADAVTGSASGLDPHISPQNAKLQAQRIADARHVRVEQIEDVIAEYTQGPSLGIFGDPGMNVLEANLALDKAYPITSAAVSSTEAATTRPAPTP